MTQPRTHARFPAVAPGRGHYESFYLKASHPTEPIAVWIRYTVHKQAGAAPTGSLWFTLFDAVASRPFASKVTLPNPTSGSDHYIQIGASRFEPGRVFGSATSSRLEASWELEFDGGAAPLFHLPQRWMYFAPIPRTKLESPCPAATFSGVIEAGGRRIELSGWPGMVGHNWGSQHAERAVWLQATAFAEDPGAWLDVGIGRVKLGPVTTPWIANGELSLGGARTRLGGIERVRATRIDETPEGCSFVLPGDGIRVEGRASAPRENFVGWIYADPDGGEHQTVNCSIADVGLEVFRDGAPPLTLTAHAAGAYELQMRERYEKIPVEPFGDG